MNWKQYESLSIEEKRNETYYIIGLDLGNDSSGIAFYNLSANAPEVIDLSGGYGKPSMPTVVQYIAETDEWVFGEYAVLNSGGSAGAEVTLSALVERLGDFDAVEAGGRSLSLASVLALFIKEILGNVRNINPRAEIVGIVSTIPAYLGEQAREELQLAFKLAGYEKELIALVSDRECVLAHYYQNAPEKEERTMLLDFGARELRGGLYHVKADKDGIKAVSMSSLFSDEISTGIVNDVVADFFSAFMRKQVAKEMPISATLLEQLQAHVAEFSYRHRDMLFQKSIRTKPVKVYFNFAYPPVQGEVTDKQVQSLVQPYAKRFDSFIQDVLEKCISDTPVAPGDIDTVLCVGGGFEMLWAKEAVSEWFANAEINFYKNPKMTTCEGAAIVAARKLGIPEAGAKLKLEDAHQLTCDIGISDGKHFLPLVERNAFWWQEHPSKLILVNQAVNGELDLGLCRRNAAGELQRIGSMQLRGLPARPKGTTRLEVGLSFISNADVIVTVKDMGFGEMFPQVEYEKDVQVKLAKEVINGEG